jgi:hypothetical protein
MKRRTIENILKFLEAKDNKEIPYRWFDSLQKHNLVTKLENHPDDIQYKHNGNLELINTPITKLPNDLYVEGGLELNDCVKLTKLPDNLYVEGDLNLFNCRNITELPNKLYVEGFFIIVKTKLANKYSDEEIYEMVRLGGGEIKGDILR